MRIPRASLIVLACTFFLAMSGFPVALANTVFIAQSGGTFSGGSACNGQSTQAVSYFNSSGNWTSGTPTGQQIGPGTTVYLCGTISSQLAFQGSGNSSNPITLIFDSGAEMSASGTTWHANEPLYLVNRSYIVINGGTNNVGGGTTDLQATGNGTGLATQVSISAIDVSGASNITIENFGCGPLYQHTSASDTSPGADSGGCVTANPQGANITVANSTFHDTTDGILFSVANTGTLNMNVYGNDFYNIDHDIFTTCGSGGTSSGFYFHNNKIHDSANWDTTADAFHHDGWILNYTTGEACTQVYDYDNQYYGNIGQMNTSWIFFDNNGGTLDAVYVFNDVFMNSNPTYTWNNGINIMPNNSGGSAHIWNNTVICPVSGGIGLQTEGQNMDVRNNVSSGCGNFFDTSNAGSATVAAFDYNYYADLIPDGTGAFGFLGDATTASGTLSQQFSSWKTIVDSLQAGAETHSGEGSTADLNSSGQPQAGSPVIGAGTNLYSTCSGQPTPGLGALCQDIAGKARPTSGDWDIGAFMSGTTPTPGAPTGLNGTLQGTQ